MPVYHDPTDGVTVSAQMLHGLAAAILGALGTPPDIAADVAEVLVAADRRGIASHGTARLPNYAALVEAGVLDPVARPIAVSERPALAQFDARNGWGPHAGRVALDWTVEAAGGQGIATAIVSHSNHFGIAGWYALRAAAAGRIGISLSNASPLVAPTRALQPLIGTNPIAIAAPAGHWGAFCLDMATSTVPRGRIEVAARRGEILPVGWAIDETGRPATSPEAALRGALQPLGGGESTAGYKGYGLGLAVDLLTGVLSGSAFGPDIVPLFSTHHGPSDNAQTYIAIDPAALVGGDGFERRLEGYLDRLVVAPTIADAPDRVLVPGEPEAAADRRSSEHGIVIDAVHASGLATLAERLGLGLPFDAPAGS
jgi:LDH2 family malate/lactate/ureidoglycolate dehydrogenase